VFVALKLLGLATVAPAEEGQMIRGEGVQTQTAMPMPVEVIQTAVIVHPQQQQQQQVQMQQVLAVAPSAVRVSQPEGIETRLL